MHHDDSHNIEIDHDDFQKKLKEIERMKLDETWWNLMKFDENLYFIKFHQISSSFIKFDLFLFLADLFWKKIFKKKMDQQFMNILMKMFPFIYFNLILFYFIYDFPTPFLACRYV